MKRLVFSLVIFLIMLAGCSEKETIVPVQPSLTISPPTSALTPTHSPTIKIANTSTPTLEVTNTPQSAPVKTGTVTPTLPPDFLSDQCLEVADSLPVEFKGNGIVILFDIFNPAIFRSLQSGEELKINEEVLNAQGAFDVSPNHEFVLYQTSNKIVIATSDNQPVWSQNSDEWLIANWFNNEQLIVLEPKSDQLPSYILWNPFTGARQELPNILPDLSDYQPFFWGLTRIVFDPTLTQAVYPLENGSKQAWPIILWDLDKHREIARLVTKDTYGYKPIWLSNG